MLTTGCIGRPRGTQYAGSRGPGAGRAPALAAWRGLFEIEAKLAEAHPDEAVLNHVAGTRQLVETSLAHGAFDAREKWTTYARQE